MIKELINKDYLHKDSKTFNNFFVERPKTANEIAKERLLNSKLLDFYNKVYDPEKEYIDITMFDLDLNSYGYIDNYGYYSVCYDSFGYYIAHNFEDDLDSIFVSLARSILAKKRNEYLYQNKKIVKKEFKEKHHNLKDFDIIYSSEYDLAKWNIYYDGNIPKEISYMYEMEDNYDSKKTKVKKRSL